MSNQNNTMQKLDLQSNVNLNRFKDNISGELRINDTNMPVLGGKFNPIKKGNSAFTGRFLMEVDGNVYDYNNYVNREDDTFYQYKKYPVNYDYRDTNNAVSATDLFTIYYEEGICGVQHDIYFKPIQAFNNSDMRKFGCWKIDTNEYFLSDGSTGVVFDYSADAEQWSFRTLLTFEDIIGVIKVPVLSSYTDETHYTVGDTSVTCVLYKSGESTNGNTKLRIISQTREYTFTGDNWMCFSYGENNIKCLFDSNFKEIGFNSSNGFVSFIPTQGVIGYENYILIKDGLTEYNYIKTNLQRNGWIFTNSIQFGSVDKFKVITSHPFEETSNNSHAVCFYTSFENGIPTDNHIFAVYHNNIPTWYQGCNIIAHNGVSMGIIDQNYMVFDASKTYIEGRFRANNKKWYNIKAITNEEAKTTETIDVIELDGKIYYGDNIDDFTKEGLYSQRLCSSGKIGKYDIKTFFTMLNAYVTNEYYTSLDDWTNKAKYWIIGTGKIIDGNYRLPQLAPILTSSVDTVETIAKFYNFTELYFQKTKDDATLYNVNNDAYIAPTDGDFFIPLMPTDKVVSRSPSGIVIERLDGSKAELLRYNNKYYPAYYYSTISENIENVFVCQGQIYNISGGVIYDSSANGIVDVSDQQFIGCNGIIALFYCDRNKTIYQFSANNSLEILFESDNIDLILKVDISHTNDEIYIIYRNFDNEIKLLCIESDGQSYIITDIKDNVDLWSPTFFISSKGVYVHEGETWKLYKRLIASDSWNDSNNNYIETNYFGTDEFKLMNVDRIFLRFVPTAMDGTENSITVNLSMLTLDGEVNEQYEIKNPSKGFFRIAPKQKQCLGIKVRLDGLDNYTLSALSIGVTDDCNIVTNNRVENKRLDVTMFD